MSEHNKSLFHHTFALPPSWKEITVVQLCPDQHLSCVLKRLNDFGRPIKVVLRQDSQLQIPNAQRHFRPSEPSKRFGEYCHSQIFTPQSGHAGERDKGVLFVFSDMQDPTKVLRGDSLMDVFEEIYLNRDPLNPCSAALINEAEVWIRWESFFAMGEVRVPVSGEEVELPAWVLGPVKQRIVDVAFNQAKFGPMVEVGRLFGGTAVLMGLGLKNANCNSKVFSFDPFPHPYNDRFLEMYDVQDDVALVDIPSDQGALFWQSQNMPPISFLHIDGDHRYQSVINDINLWYPLMAEDGVIMFDDYGWGVQKLAGSTRAIFEEVVSKPECWHNVQSLGKSLIAMKKRNNGLESRVNG